MLAVRAMRTGPAYSGRVDHNRVLRFGTADIREDYLTTIRETAEYVGEIFRILREHEYNPLLCGSMWAAEAVWSVTSGLMTPTA
ncbi:MAG: hypothetical protein ACLRIS_17425 [Flavonifractor plautii]